MAELFFQISSGFAILGAILYLIYLSQISTTKRQFTDETFKIAKDLGVSPKEARKLTDNQLQFLIANQKALNETVLEKLDNDLIRMSDRANKILYATVICFIVAIFLFFYKKDTLMSCGEVKCETCEECYYLGCFEVALDCYEKKGTANDNEKTHKTECQKIVRADNFFNARDFSNALTFYSDLTDPFAQKQKKCNKEFCMNWIEMEQLDRIGKYKEAMEALNKSKDCVFPEDIKNTIRDTQNELFKKEKEKIKPVNKEKLEWEGFWYQKQSGKKGEITGIVNISFNSTFAKAYFVDNFTKGGIQKGELSELTFRENDTLLTGKWKNFNTNLVGDFLLKKISNSTFEGYYTMPNDSKKYYWKGNKKFIQ